MALTAARSLSSSVRTQAAHKEVYDAREVAKLLEQGYTYVDVRTPEEFSAGRVPGSVNLPLGPTLPADFKAKFPDASAKLVVACQGGVRSGRALQALEAAEAQYKNLVEFKGAFNAWATSGLPIEK